MTQRMTDHVRHLLNLWIGELLHMYTLPQCNSWFAMRFHWSTLGQ